MSIIHAIILAVVEGFTEFLPISSTAHMKIVDYLLSIPETPFRNMYEIVIQFAAILAVVLIYRRKFFDFKNINFYLKLIVAVIPALIGGVLLKKHIDAALSNLQFIAFVMLAGGVLLLFVDKWFSKNKIKDEQHVDFLTAFKIGCFQVLSIVFPGLSRSAATIAGGMSLGMTRKSAAEFSFFLAVPTMLAASVKSLYDVAKEGTVSFSTAEVSTLLIGCAVSFAVAFFAVKFFIEMLQRNGFRFFGFYRIALGIFILILLLVKQ